MNIVPAETGVKIIERDGESVTIGKFNKDGTYSDKPFRILTATDLHLGDTPSLRRKTMQMLANHISQAKPDLVIFTGDVILSKYQQLDSVQFARFMEKPGSTGLLCSAITRYARKRASTSGLCSTP